MKPFILVMHLFRATSYFQIETKKIILKPKKMKPELLKATAVYFEFCSGVLPAGGTLRQVFHFFIGALNFRVECPGLGGVLRSASSLPLERRHCAP